MLALFSSLHLAILKFFLQCVLYRRDDQNGLFHMICVATVEKNKIKEVCPRLRLNIQMCQSIAGCHQVIHQENDRSLVRLLG
jgi:hypothetical protein